MPNPYSGRPEYTFWRQGVAECATGAVDPVVEAAFTIGPADAVATAGSCFAQHISRTLADQGFCHFVTERYDPGPGIADENYGVFPARFGNIYTARQLLQLFDRAYGTFSPADVYWTDNNGQIVDPFRPRIQSAGFGAPENLERDREKHFSAVRHMFEQCRVFIFTLGLTEAWMSTIDGSIFPLARGVVRSVASVTDCKFHNFEVEEVVADTIGFLDRLRSVNSAARVILTVSPVPLIATYEDRHVLVSTIGSKSILRAAVEQVVRRRPEVCYFPSYEIVTGPQAGARFYAPDLREISAEGVAHVMSLFSRHYLGAAAGGKTHTPDTPELTAEDEARMNELAAVICDEEAILE